ncbi:MAG: hypothetical protein O7E52_17270 [Candidatus Poribacteria bacterium]|nr:hypothetical protein [Candidatus Poribacteria bacterium]
MQINIRESDATLVAVVERVLAGEEIILDRDGEPVAKVVPYRQSKISDTAAETGNRTLADRLEGYIGVLDSSENVPGGANMSQSIGKKFSEGMVKKHQKHQQ